MVITIVEQVEKDNAMDRSDVCEQAAKDAKVNMILRTMTKTKKTETKKRKSKDKDRVKDKNRNIIEMTTIVTRR